MKWVVVVAALLALGLSVLPVTAEEEEPGTGPSLEVPAKKERPRPAAWDRWNEEQRQRWTRRMERAREAVRRQEQARLNAAINAMEQTAAEGVPVEEAEQMARTGLDEGLQPDEFENLGQFVKSRVQQGLRGQELADAVHQRIRMRKQQRWEERDRKRQERSEGRGRAAGDDDDEEDEREAGRGRGRDDERGQGRGRGGGAPDDDDDDDDDDDGRGGGRGRGGRGRGGGRGNR
jgi:hypothetical protein